MADEADSDDGDEDAEDEGDGAGVGPSNDAAAVGDGGADDGPPPKRLQRGFGAPASTTPNARTEANRRPALTPPRPNARTCSRLLQRPRLAVRQEHQPLLVAPTRRELPGCGPSPTLLPQG